MISQAEEEADLTSQEEVEGVAKEDSVAGTMETISALILDPLNSAGVVIKSLISCFTLCLFPDHISGSPFSPGRGRGCCYRGQGRGYTIDRDMEDQGFPSSLGSPREGNKWDNGMRSESSFRPLEKIFMTDENQEQLKELLRDLQSQEYDEMYR